MTEKNAIRLFRGDGERSHAVRPIELFFDLVFVFAITQLSHTLLEHFDPRGALHTALLLLAVWWMWVYTAWFANWFDPDRRPVRIVLIALMVGSLLMSASIPEAFGERGMLFAASYVAMQVGRSLFVIWAAGDNLMLRSNFQRIACWSAFSGIFWIAGALVAGPAREWLWIAAVLIDYLAPAALFFVPGLGRSTTRVWNISGEHMAERCQLFLIIALGESILVTGSTFSELDGSWVFLIAFVVAFLGSVALWWVYFDRAAGDAAEAIAHSDDPGGLARSAYTYFHLPMVAGIIVTAVGDELAIAHPLDQASLPTIVSVLGGPALFLAGHLLFKRAVFGVWSVPRIVAIVVLVAIGFAGREWPALVLAVAALLVIGGVIVWDVRTLHQRDATRLG